MTAAPTLVVSDAGTGAADTDVSLAGVAAGDLVVIVVNDQEASATLTTTAAGNSITPSWASDISASDGTRRNYIQSVICANGQAGTWVVSVSPFASGASRRIFGLVFRPATGDSWGSARVFASVSQSTTAGGASQDVGTYSDPAKPCVAVGTIYSPSTSSGTTATYQWDGAAATVPLYNPATDADTLDYQLYADTGGTRPSKLHITLGMNNGHEATAIIYQTQNGVTNPFDKGTERDVLRGVARGVAG